MDVFLKLVGLVKTRMAGKKLVESGRLKLDGRTVKPSHEVSVGGILEADLPARRVRTRILALPPTPTVARRDRGLYVEVENLPEEF